MLLLWPGQQQKHCVSRNTFLCLQLIEKVGHFHKHEKLIKCVEIPQTLEKYEHMSGYLYFC
jgi:hypothetical protein